MKAFQTLAALAALATTAAAVPAAAAQIVLSPNMIIGVFGTPDGKPGAVNAVDQQTGLVKIDPTSWTSSFGGAIVIDLGRAYDFSYFEAFTTQGNTFSVVGHNRVEYNPFGGYGIPTGSTLLASGALVDDAGDGSGTLTAQRFASQSEASFRYIGFNFGAGTHRLDEFRLFDGDTPLPGSAAPEPASWALLISGFGMAGAALRRRQRLAVA